MILITRISLVTPVKSSVIQGSGLGPESFTLTASDLHPLHPRNHVFKFADDTHLVVPASSTGWRQDESTHIERWAENKKNLRINTSKSKELVFRAPGLRGKSEQLPPTCVNIERVTSHTVLLGENVNERLTADNHVNSLLSSTPDYLYALRILRNHGTPTQTLRDVTVVAKMTYCAPAWSGYCLAAVAVVHEY